MAASERRAPAVARGFAPEAVALVAFALAQPLYDQLARNATVLATHGAGRAEVLAVVVAAQVLPSALVVAVDRALRRAGAGAAAAGRALAVALLVAAALLPPLHRALPALPALAAALAAGALAGRWHARGGAFRRLLRALAVAAPVFAAVFVLRPATAPFVRDPRAPADAGRAAPVTVVLAVFDELPVGSLLTPSGEIDGELFPAFARLAARSTWFRNAATTQASTRFAIPALLTGRDPEDPDAVPVLADYPDNLLAHLAPTHRLELFGSLRALAPARARPGGPGRAARLRALLRDAAVLYAHALVPAAWSGGLPPVDDAWRDFGAERTDAEAWRAGLDDGGRAGDPAADWRALVASIQPDGGAAAHAIHAVLPHAPWTYTPEGSVYAAPRREESAGLALQRHLLQLGFTDHLLGELVDRLERTGLWDDALVVVTADHGASFRTAQRRRLLTPDRLLDVAGVPLFVKRPRQRAPERRDDPVTTLDVAPTVAAELGIALPGVGGRPLFGGRPQAGRTRAVRAGPAAPPHPLPPELPATRPLVDLKNRRLGAAPGWPGVWTPVAARDAVGRPVDELADGAVLRAVVRLDWGGGLGRTGGYVAGSVETRDAPPPDEVAVAVDGVVRAVAPTLERSGRTARFAALVPPLPPGDAPPRLAFFGSRGRGRARTLVRLDAAD